MFSPCRDAVLAYMKYRTDFCCGSKCPSSLVTQVEAALGRPIVRSMLSPELADSPVVRADVDAFDAAAVVDSAKGTEKRRS